MFWRGKKVLVTGGGGFVGSHVVDLLLAAGANVAAADYSNNAIPANLAHVVGDIEYVNLDLLDPAAAEATCAGRDVVLNLAAKTGGIGYNVTHQGTVFRDNALMTSNILEAARKSGVERFLTVSSALVYPADASVPTPETEGFRGDPESDNFGYGWAKRFAEIQSRTYADEFGMKIAIARPYNAYGPRANFDPATSHVVAALIKRVVDGENPVVVWGDGNQRRAFLHVKDFARGLMMTAENYAECDPVNIGADEETRIRDLVALIISLSGSDAEPFFDASKPGGSPRRSCDTAKAKEKVGFRAEINLEEGLRETIQWYKQHGRS